MFSIVYRDEVAANMEVQLYNLGTHQAWSRDRSKMHKKGEWTYLRCLFNIATIIFPSDHESYLIQVIFWKASHPLEREK